MNISKNGVGIVLLILGLFGLELSETEIQALIGSVGVIYSLTLLLWNQWARKDTKWFLWKTDEQD